MLPNKKIVFMKLTYINQIRNELSDKNVTIENKLFHQQETYFERILSKNNRRI